MDHYQFFLYKCQERNMPRAVCTYSVKNRVELQWLQLWWLIHLVMLELPLWSLHVILCIVHPGWLKLPLARTIFHGSKPVRDIEVLLYVILNSRTPDQDFRCFYPCEINRIHHWCSVGTEKSQPEGPPFQWETRLAEFPTERWTRGWDLSGTTEHQWSILFIDFSYTTTVRHSTV